MEAARVLRFWRFLAIYLTALTLALTFSHLLEMPRKMQYGEALYLAVQHSLYFYFAWVGGIAEVGAVVSLAVLSMLARGRGAVSGLTLAAALLVAAGLALWFVFVNSANRQMALWTGVPLPADWMEVRRRWEYGHAASAIMDLAGFGALVLSVLLETPKHAGR